MNFEVKSKSVNIEEFYTPKFKKLLVDTTRKLVFDDSIKDILSCSTKGQKRQKCFELKGYNDLERLLLANMFTSDEPVEVLDLNEFMNKYNIANTMVLNYCIANNQVRSNKSPIGYNLNNSLFLNWGRNLNTGEPHYILINKEDALRDSKGKYALMSFINFNLSDLKSINSTEVFPNDLYTSLSSVHDFNTGIPHLNVLASYIRESNELYFCDLSHMSSQIIDGNNLLFVYSTLSDKLYALKYDDIDVYNSFTEVKSVQYYAEYLPLCMYKSDNTFDRLKEDARALNFKGQFGGNNFGLEVFKKYLMGFPNIIISREEDFYTNLNIKIHLVEIVNGSCFYTLRFAETRNEFYGFNSGTIEAYKYNDSKEF